MARIDYKFVEFHGPFFLNGTNFKPKVTASPDTKLWYDTELGFMCMEHKGHMVHFDSFHSAVVKEKAEETQPAKRASQATK